MTSLGIGDDRILMLATQDYNREWLTPGYKKHDTAVGDFARNWGIPRPSGNLLKLQQENAELREQVEIQRLEIENAKLRDKLGIRSTKTRSRTRPQ